MEEALLSVQGVCASAGEKPILHGIDLAIGKGETHVLMGPNGAGKSTLGQVIMGNPTYTMTDGAIVLEGKDISEENVAERSRDGLFLSFQAPVEVPGVPLQSFLRAIVAQHPELNLKGKRFKKRIAEILEQLNMSADYLDRELNVGFSGGEKKKIEMLQLLLLKPKLAILDETDSGLDVDALNVVSKAIAAYRAENDGTILLITHNTRILEHLSVDRTHVMVKGNLVAEGDASLIGDIDKHGFEQFGVAEDIEGNKISHALDEDEAPAFDAEAALAHAEAAVKAAEAK
ncbi:MAG: Fe-S cluster assembly ATPase SufC [Eggerthellaceae bacterium]|nr:Fe-S cluster assembly ATPase SufC [Eggerthellaceae bacterium]